jgi:hypothetical protein
LKGQFLIFGIVAILWVVIVLMGIQLDRLFHRLRQTARIADIALPAEGHAKILWYNDVGIRHRVIKYQIDGQCWLEFEEKNRMGIAIVPVACE